MEQRSTGRVHLLGQRRTRQRRVQSGLRRLKRKGSRPLARYPLRAKAAISVPLTGGGQEWCQQRRRPVFSRPNCSRTGTIAGFFCTGARPDRLQAARGKQRWFPAGSPGLSWRSCSVMTIAWDFGEEGCNCVLIPSAAMRIDINRSGLLRSAPFQVLRTGVRRDSLPRRKPSRCTR